MISMHLHRQSVAPRVGFTTFFSCIQIVPKPLNLKPYTAWICNELGAAWGAVGWFTGLLLRISRQITIVGKAFMYHTSISWWVIWRSLTAAQFRAYMEVQCSYINLD